MLVAQGKQMLVGGEAFPYNVNRFLITSLDLPANSQIVTTSPDKPCLRLVMKLDLRIMAELIAQGRTPLPADRVVDRGIGIGLGTVTTPFNEAFKRLLGSSTPPMPPCWHR